MSTSWSGPDPRRTPTAPPAFGSAEPEPAEDRPSLGEDVRAGVLTAVLLVLAGAPVGLLWASSAPRVDVVVAGARVDLAVPGDSAFIAGDGYFLFAVLVAGVASGLSAWLLASRHGPAVVAGLTAGGLVAAYVAMVVGQEVGAEGVRAAVEAGQQGALTLNLRLRATEALVGWPVGALIAYLSAALALGRR